MIYCILLIRSGRKKHEQTLKKLSFCHDCSKLLPKSLEISRGEDFHVLFHGSVICNTVHFIFCHLFSLLFNSCANSVCNVISEGSYMLLSLLLP